MENQTQDKPAKMAEGRKIMSTTKQNQNQGVEKEYNAYDEYLYEMNKKYECERARVFKQIEQEK